VDFINILKATGSFFDLTEAERDGMEKKLDEALAVFKIEKS
jgi:hypothetical protein